MSESLDQPIEVPELTADEIQARVLHRDGLMLVIDKPAGLPVHRGPKGGANLESSFDALRFGLPRPPVLAHRLDRDTSRCPVLGRHRKATAPRGPLFKPGRVSESHRAVVEGGPVADEGVSAVPPRRLNAARGGAGAYGRAAQAVRVEWGVIFLAVSPCGRGWLSSSDASRVRGLFLRMQTPHPARTSSAPPSPTRGEGRGLSHRQPRTVISG